MSEVPSNLVTAQTLQEAIHAFVRANPGVFPYKMAVYITITVNGEAQAVPLEGISFGYMPGPEKANGKPGPDIPVLFLETVKEIGPLPVVPVGT